MDSIICDFFEKEKIEYYGILPVEECTFTRRYLLEKTEREQGFLAKSVICYAVPYYTSEGKNISKYAVSRDYHVYMSSLADRLCEYISSKFPGSHSCGFSDHSPVDEVRLAAKSGLGVIGKNRLLITKKHSSFVFIGEVFTDIDAKILGYAKAEHENECINCGECQRSCPTSALSCASAECLSSVTQKKGLLSKEEAEMIVKNGTAWGCDVCQDVCPYTMNAIRNNTIVTPIKYFHENQVSYIDDDVLDSMDEKEFSVRAYAWRKRETIKRNLEILQGTEDEALQKKQPKTHYTQQ